MKSALRKNAFIEIFKTKSRFLSIFCIVAIGIAFFAGVKNTAPDMKNSSDSYYKSANLAHFRLLSTLGFTQDDIAALEAVGGVTVYPGYFADVVVKNGEQDEIFRVMSLKDYGTNNGVNSLVLSEGRFPEKPGECIVDSGGLVSKKKVGEQIKMLSGDGNDISDTLSVTEFTVVGTFVSPAYIDKSSRGNTTIGNGNISSIAYIPEESFSIEVYTELHVTADSLSALNAYTDGYDEENDRVKALLEDIGSNREIERYDEILGEANEEIEKAQKELDDARAEVEQELDDAKKKLDDALKEIEEGEEELRDAKKQLDEAKAELSDSRSTLDYNWSLYHSGVEELNDKTDKARVQIEEQRRQIREGYTQYNSGVDEYQQGLNEYNAGYGQYTAGLAQYEEGIAYYTLLDNYYKGYISPYKLAEALGVDLSNGTSMDEEVPFSEENGAGSSGLSLLNQGEGIEFVEDNPSAQILFPDPIMEFLSSLPDEGTVTYTLAELGQTKAVLDQTAQQLDASKAQLEAARVQLEETKRTLDDGSEQLDSAEAELETEKANGEQTLADTWAQLAEAERQYEQGIEDYRQGELDYADGVLKLQEGRDEYNSGLKEYEEGKAEAEAEIADGEQKIRDAKRELQDLENPEWYVFDRSGNVGYTEYGQNAERINNIASVFPVFFILVAALVCLTTMTRMVEEQRSQIGTLKALGYSNGQIIFKYLFYALSATLFGALAGAIFGQKLFPFAIISAYGMLYSMDTMIIPTDWLLTGASMLVAAAAVTLTVYVSCRSELSEQPAQLMRPKAPRAGKMILLDRMPFWKKVGFNGKVTARNLFRYKRRMFMTIVGIAGCTALTLTGFALEDSISDIINKQYGELVFYDGILAYDSVDQGDTDNIISIIENNNCSSTKYYQKKITVASDSGRADAYLVVPENKEEFSEFYLFRDRTDHTQREFYDDRVIIDEKLSYLLGVRENDDIVIYREETNPKTVNVSACVENYPNHYVYMSKEMYTELFGEAPEYNIMAFGGREENVLSDEDSQNAFAEQLLATNAVLSVNFKEDMVVTMSAMLNALNSVVAILIISAGALAFVVLYNLTNINITERIREIATLKVMGFFDKEVDSYIFRENIILTLMGIAVGLFGGTFLARFIIQTAEIDLVMFGREISVMSYVYSALITLVFSIVVVIYMHGHLKRVDMIEALKSVE